MAAPPADDARPGLTFTKDDRLLRRSQFLAVQAKGRRLHSAHFIVIVLDRGDGARPRVGITASRKAANSVGRNRVRRLVREVFRAHRGAFPAGHDCVVIVRENVPDLALDQVRAELLSALAPRGRRPDPPGAGPPRDTKMPAPRAAPARGREASRR